MKLQWGQWSLEWRARNSSAQPPRVVVLRRRAVVLCPVRDGQAQLLLVGQECCSMLTTMKLTAAVFQPRQRIVGKAEQNYYYVLASSSSVASQLYPTDSRTLLSSPRATPQRCLLYWQCWTENGRRTARRKREILIPRILYTASQSRTTKL